MISRIYVAYGDLSGIIAFFWKFIGKKYIVATSSPHGAVYQTSIGLLDGRNRKSRKKVFWNKILIIYYFSECCQLTLHWHRHNISFSVIFDMFFSTDILDHIYGEVRSDAKSLNIIILFPIFEEEEKRFQTNISL